MTETMQIQEGAVEAQYLDFQTEDEDGRPWRDGAPMPRRNLCSDLTQAINGCRLEVHNYHRGLSQRLGNILRKVPDITKVPIIAHYCERRLVFKICLMCWFPALSFLTIFWGFWLLCLMGVIKGDPLDNAELVKTVEDLSHRNSTITEVCRFKDWTYFVGSKAGKVLNHHGVVLSVTNSSEMPEGFLQLEYGARGTFWQYSTSPKPDARYGETAVEKVGPIRCRYKCGTVALSQRDPKRFLWFLHKYRLRPYNIFYYTCVTFAEMVWRFHMPYHERCLSTAQMEAEYLTVSRLVTGGDSPVMMARSAVS